MASKNYSKTVISLDEDYTSIERRAIADDFVEYIRERTLAGKGKGNKAWSGAAGRYSKSYKASDDFKAKAAKGVVNLELSGDMLSSIEKLPSGSNEVAVGILKSDQDYGKAEGNIRGTYGSKKANPSKARDFMDLSDDEIEKVLRPYKSAKSREKKVAAFKAALVLAREAAKEEAGIDRRI